MDKVTLPRHIFEDLEKHAKSGCQKYLVIIEPDGKGGIDGCHEDGQGVAQAKKLIESIKIITPPPGTIYSMITVEPVPALAKDDINYEAVHSLNQMADSNRRRRKGSGRTQ